MAARLLCKLGAKPEPSEGTVNPQTVFPNQRPSRNYHAGLAIAIAIMLSSTARAQTSFSLEFNADGVLPSSLGFQYVTGGNPGQPTSGAPEATVFSVSDGLLHMNTAALGPNMGFAYYEKAGLFDPTKDLLIEMRLALYADSAREFHIMARAQDLTYAGLVFENGQMIVLRDHPPYPQFPVVDTGFHTYRIYYRAATRRYEVFVDGVQLGGAETLTNTGAPPNLFLFGDGGGSPGGNGRADIDYIRFQNPPPGTTPPVITPQIGGTLGNNGWYVSNVSISWTVVDLESAVASTSGCGASVVTADTGGVTFTCTATSAGGTATQSITVKRDATPPAILAGRAPAPNSNGWNNTNVTVTFNCSDLLSGAVTPGFSSTVSTEGAGQSVPGSCVDNAGNTAGVVVNGINIDKQAPAVSSTTLAPNPQQVGAVIALSASLTDYGPSGLANWQYTVDGGAPVSANTSGGSASVAASITLAVAGVYEVCVRTVDLAGNQSPPVCTFAVAYDPSAGYVTGGGWFESPAGAYAADPTLTGQATFGFVSRYQTGASAPTGNTQFQFHAANLTFKSTAYEWLVVAGARAQYKGTGKVNGVDGYSFILTAIDGQTPGGGGIDR